MPDDRAGHRRGQVLRRKRLNRPPEELARLNPGLCGIVAVPHKESGYAAMLESAAVRALLLSLAAGLSTLLGALVVICRPEKE